MGAIFEHCEERQLKTYQSKQARPIRALVFSAIAFAAAATEAQTGFDRGTSRVSVNIGTSTTFSSNYVQIGIGAGYYPLDGLELGLDARLWLGGELDIYEAAPSVTYVFTQLGTLKPYGGLLYRHTFIEGREDLSAYGARGGIFLQQSQNLVVRAGVAAIRYRNCERTTGSDCTEYYPEVSAGFYF